MGKIVMSKIPSFQFYPGDWLREASLRACSLAARGLWTDMLCWMHDSPVRGRLLKSTGDAFTEPELARMSGCSVPQLRKLLLELANSGALSRDEKGVIYSRRMVSDEQDRMANIEFGSLGGNPKLMAEYNKPGFVYVMVRADGLFKIGISIQPEKRAYKLRKQLRDATVRVVRKFEVDDMGASEALLHEAFKAKRALGEWFSLAESDLETVGRIAREKAIPPTIPPTVLPVGGTASPCTIPPVGNTQGNQTPSSSSSSSSSTSSSNTLSASADGGSKSDEGKKANDAKPKRKGTPNPLFDAVAEITASDPTTAAGYIAKVAAALNAANPPYTPEDVREFGRRAKEICTWLREPPRPPTLSDVEKHIGKLRLKPPPTASAPKKYFGDNPETDF